MITWSGHGYLVAVITYGISLLTEVVTESAFADEQYYQREAWPLALALFAAGSVLLPIGRRLNSADGYGRHSLFFLPVQWWGPILLMAALVVFIQRSVF